MCTEYSSEFEFQLQNGFEMPVGVASTPVLSTGKSEPQAVICCLLTVRTEYSSAWYDTLLVPVLTSIIRTYIPEKTSLLL